MKSIRCVLSALILACAVQSLYAQNSLSVLTYGAKCDGVTDDTLALRGAIAAADMFPYHNLSLPGSICLFTDTLVFGGQTDRYSTISLEGQSEYSSMLLYTGPSDRPAVLLSHMSAFEWGHLSVHNGGGHGSSVGIQLDGPFNGGGTQNTTITFNHLSVSNFHAGMLAGGGDAASEIDCHQCTFANNDIGFSPSGYNALNFWFYVVHLNANQYGMQFGPWPSDGVHVIGGDSAGNTIADFGFKNGFDIFAVQGFRAQIQAGAQFLAPVDATPFNYPMVAVSNSVIVGTATAVVMTLPFNVRLTSDRIQGLIGIPEGRGLSITIWDSSVYEGTPGYPIIFPSGGSVHFNFANNFFQNSSTIPPPKIGTYNWGVFGN